MISLVSNVAAVAITLTVMATGVGGLTLAAVAVVASLASLFSSRIVQDSYHNMIDTLWRRYYENQSSANYSENMVVSPQLTYASQQEYMNNHGGARLVCKWDPATDESWCDAVPASVFPRGGGGWSDWNYWNYWNDYGGWGGGGGGGWGPGGEVIVGPIQPDDEYQNDEYL